MTGIAPLLGAIALIGLGGLFAAIDAAISTVSMARVEELVRDERPGASVAALDVRFGELRLCQESGQGREGRMHPRWRAGLGRVRGDGYRRYRRRRHAQ